jgi:hypothetical protein
VVTIVFSLFYSIRQGLRSTAATDRACALLIDFCGFGSRSSSSSTAEILEWLAIGRYDRQTGNVIAWHRRVR